MRGWMDRVGDGWKLSCLYSMQWCFIRSALVELLGEELNFTADVLRVLHLN